MSDLSNADRPCYYCEGSGLMDAGDFGASERWIRCYVCKGTGKRPTDRCYMCGHDFSGCIHYEHDGSYVCCICAEIAFNDGPNGSPTPTNDYKGTDCVYFEKEWVNFNAECCEPDYGWTSYCNHPDMGREGYRPRCTGGDPLTCELRRTVPLRPVLCRNELRFDHYTSCDFFVAGAKLAKHIGPTIREMMDVCRFRCSGKQEGDAP